MVSMVVVGHTRSPKDFQFVLVKKDFKVRLSKCVEAFEVDAGLNRGDWKPPRVIVPRHDHVTPQHSITHNNLTVSTSWYHITHCISNHIITAPDNITTLHRHITSHYTTWYDMTAQDYSTWAPHLITSHLMSQFLAILFRLHLRPSRTIPRLSHL